MSRWVAGREYDYFGARIRCLRVYFSGELELVKLEHVTDQPAEGKADNERNIRDHRLLTHLPRRDSEEAQTQVFTRAAATLAPCVFPRVTETLGGVLRSDACARHYRHKGHQHIVAADGPHRGRLCCSACGGTA